MDLTRRDVVAALSAVGVGSVAGCSNPLGEKPEEPTDGGPITDRELSTLVALAAVVYPSEVDDVEAFVRDYSAVRLRDDPSYARGVADAVAALDDYVSEWHEDPYASLSTDVRSDLLEHMGVDTADPDPDGSTDERVRYYLVNELLYAFYTTPTGAGLVGLENPPGHPGGRQSYRRGPGARERGPTGDGGTPAEPTGRNGQ